MFTTILVPLDGSALAERALPHAMALARSARAKLILFHASPTRGLPDDLGPNRVALSDLVDLADELRASGIEVECPVSRVYHDDVPHGICEAAEVMGADLIVMSTHGYGGLGRWLHGSVADAVLRQASVPVMLVPATCEQGWSDDHAARIVVPLDGSRFAEEALGPAHPLAEALVAELVLVRAVKPVNYSDRDGGPYLERRVQAEVCEARQYLEGLAAKLRASGRGVEVHVELSPPALTIANVARDRGAGLIAMATHGRGGLARLALGSVAAATLQLTSVPLLLVRPAAVRRHLPDTARVPCRPAAKEKPAGPRVTVG
ncbi:MAG TPA: universal stress protein [Chloroflexota bacterium]|nr:universal stress protein [Chloroflexota bacterium]